MRVVRSVLVSAIAVAVAMTWLVACGDDDTNGVAPIERVEADAYAAVVSWFSDREPPTEGDQPRATFLEGMDDGMIPLEVQVRVLELLDDDLAVRFIDSLDEAVDNDVEGSPVRDGGILLRLGPVVVREEHREVDVERYEDENAASRYRIELRQRAGTWRVVGEPVVIPAPDSPA